MVRTGLGGIIERMNYYFILTNSCNYHCNFCIRANVSATLSGNMDYSNFRKVAELLYNANPDAMITLTGGEPTIYPDFKDVVDFSSHLFKKVCVTTNGSFDQDTAMFLEKYMRDNLYVQISLDGTKDFHNKLRGEHAFERAVASIRLFSNVWTHLALSTTVKRCEMDNIKELATYLNCLKFHHWKVSQEQVSHPTKETIIPTKEWNHLVENLLPLCQYRVTIKKMFAFDIWEKYTEDNHDISIARNCSLGNNKVYITPNFDVLPCTCMNYSCGNLLVDSVDVIRTRLNKLQIIEPDESSICYNCDYKRICNGGCPGYSMKVFGKYNMGDIRCPLF